VRRGNLWNQSKSNTVVSKVKQVVANELKEKANVED